MRNGIDMDFGGVGLHVGKQGDQGYSAYEVAVRNGYSGTEEEWIASLFGSIDNTLSRPNTAADAQKTGEAIAAEREAREAAMNEESGERAAGLRNLQHGLTQETADRIAADMTMEQRVKSRAIANAADFVSGTLTGSNLAGAVAAALMRSSSVYIPAGTYAANLEITQDCDLYLDDKCYIVPADNSAAAIAARDCRFGLHGGNVYAGENNRDRVRIDPSGSSIGIIELTGCRNVRIEGLKCSHSKYGSVIQINGQQERPTIITQSAELPTLNCKGKVYAYNGHESGMETGCYYYHNGEEWRSWGRAYLAEEDDPYRDELERFRKPCEHVVIENCSFENVLMSAIHVLYFNRDITVRNCSFRDSRSDTRHGGETGYCYFVYTGARQLYELFTPPDGLTYENNYCEQSDDCALDTHGATNVVIRNNTILDCVCSITAYNDAGRVRRPLGWIMTNVLIENNRVDTDRSAAGMSYPHPTVFLGLCAAHRDEEYTTRQGWTFKNNPTGYSDFINCVVRNNDLRSGNDGLSNHAIIDVTVACRNLVIENNFFDGKGKTKPVNIGKGINFRVENNKMINCRSGVGLNIVGGIGVVRGNPGFGSIHANSILPTFYEGEELIAFGSTTSLYAKGGVLKRYTENGAQKVGLSNCMYGIALVDIKASDTEDITKSFKVSMKTGSNIATLQETYMDGENEEVLLNRWFPGLAIVINNTYYYVGDVIDFGHFTVVKATNEKVTNLNGDDITVTLRQCTMTALA